MRSAKPGKRTSANKAARSDVEVLSVSPHGIWLVVAGEELLLRYDDHPWFREARVGEIFHVELEHGSHLRWPDLDVDLHIDSLRDPSRFPLVSRQRRSEVGPGPAAVPRPRPPPRNRNKRSLQPR